MSTQLMRVPKGYRLEDAVVNGKTTTILVPKKRSGKRHKTSLAVRKAAATARKRFNVPIFTSVVVGIPLYNLYKAAQTPYKHLVFNAIMSPFTGMALDSKGTMTWKLRRMWGTAALFVTQGLARYVFRKPNRRLAIAKIPLRLN